MAGLKNAPPFGVEFSVEPGLDEALQASVRAWVREHVLFGSSEKHIEHEAKRYFSLAMYHFKGTLNHFQEERWRSENRCWPEDSAHEAMNA